jgi:hypothetical protein
VKQRVKWPDPRKPSVIRDESRDLGPGGGSFGVISLAGEPKREEVQELVESGVGGSVMGPSADKPAVASWGFFLRQPGVKAKWR